MNKKYVNNKKNTILRAIFCGVKIQKYIYFSNKKYLKLI